MRCPLTVFAAAAVFAALQLSLPTGPANAKECPYAPVKGSAERQAIMDAVRDRVEPELGQDVQFLVSKLRVCRKWAFLEADPLKRDGKPIDWSRSTYADAVKNDACGFYVHALLVKKKGQWTVRYHEICATDVPYVGWAETYGAPPQLFR